MTWGLVAAAAIGVGGGLLTSSMNSNAVQSAANTQAAAANQSAQVQQNIYNQTRSDLAPYLSTGTSALNQLSSLLGLGGGAPNTDALYSALQNYPGYQFNMQQGLQAVSQSEAARGLLNSGDTIRNATQFGQGLANSTLQNYLSQLGSLGSLGESAGSLTGNAGTAAGANIGNSLLAGGSAAGAGQLGSTLAMTGGINSALNNSLLAYQLYQNQGGGQMATLNGQTWTPGAGGFPEPGSGGF